MSEVDDLKKEVRELKRLVMVYEHDCVSATEGASILEEENLRFRTLLRAIRAGVFSEICRRSHPGGLTAILASIDEALASGPVKP